MAPATRPRPSDAPPPRCARGAAAGCAAYQAEPAEARLPQRQHDEGGQKRPERGAEVAADLEQGLREAVPPAGGQACDARGFGMEDRRADAEQGRTHEQMRIAVRHRQAEQACQGEHHPDRQRPGQLAPVGVQPDQRLQQRTRGLEGEGQQANLPERQVEAALEQRIDRRKQRLHRVVQQVAQGDDQQHRERRPRGRVRRRKRRGQAGRTVLQDNAAVHVR